MPFLTNISRSKKINYFFDDMDMSSIILEIGAGEGWVGTYLRENGWDNYMGLDIVPGGADIVGDIKKPDSLPFVESQFDVIIAFEVIEHIDLLNECHYFLKDGGLLMLTTPLPQMDWFCSLLENIGLNQKRTSPHSNLVNIRQLPGFETIKFDIIGFMGQWGIYKKQPNLIKNE